MLCKLNIMQQKCPYNVGWKNFNGCDGRKSEYLTLNCVFHNERLKIQTLNSLLLRDGMYLFIIIII